MRASQQSVARSVLSVLEVHRADKDGGYDCAAALCLTRGRLLEWKRVIFDQILVDIISGEREGWGAALEAVGACGGTKAIEQLNSQFRSNSGWSIQVKAQVAWVLLDRGLVDSEVERFALQNAVDRGPMGLQILALLYRQCPGALNVVAEILASQWTGDDRDGAIGSIAAFILPGADGGLSHVARLARAISARWPAFGREFAVMCLDELGKPWNAEILLDSADDVVQLRRIASE